MNYEFDNSTHYVDNVQMFFLYKITRCGLFFDSLIFIIKILWATIQKKKKIEMTPQFEACIVTFHQSKDNFLTFFQSTYCKYFLGLINLL